MTEIVQKPAPSTIVDETIHTLRIVKEVTIETESVRFEGDGYTEKWQRDAEARGLDHLKNTPDSLKAYAYPGTKKMLTAMGILTEEELTSRVHVFYERYIKKLEIEVEAMRTLLDNYVFPACSLYAGELARAASQIKSIAGAVAAPQEEKVKKITKLLEELKVPPFPGGRRLRAPLLFLALSWYALRDRI